MKQTNATHLHLLNKCWIPLQDVCDVNQPSSLGANTHQMLVRCDINMPIHLATLARSQTSFEGSVWEAVLVVVKDWAWSAILACRQRPRLLLTEVTDLELLQIEMLISDRRFIREISFLLNALHEEENKR